MSLIDDISAIDASGAALRTIREVAGGGATDPGTGLPTWRGLQFRLESGRADAPVWGAVVHVDRPLSGASPFGDDPVLRRLGEEVRRHLPRGSEVARLGADELVLVIPGVAVGLIDPSAVVRAAAVHLSSDVGLGLRATDVTCREMPPTTSLGLLGQVRRVQSKLLAETGAPARHGDPAEPTGDDLDRALHRSEFRLAYQPVLDQSGSVAAVEALVRWESPERGLLLPGAFLPAVERNGLDRAVGNWVLGQALRDAAAWNDADLGGVPVVVNVTASQLSADDLADVVHAGISSTGAPGVVLEIAPRQDEVDLHGLVGAFQELREAGARLSLDRVDSGAVSAGILSVLPFVDTVKLDRSVVADLHGGGRATAAALRILAERAGVRLGATGVETADQLTTLRTLGVDLVQGYRFCPPVRAADLPGRANPLAPRD